MDDDATAARRFLLGRGMRTETVYTKEGRRIEQHIGEIGARAALVRLLRSSSPSPDILNMLANAIEQIGSSEMRLDVIAVLVRRAGRGRPRKRAHAAFTQNMKAKEIEAAAGSKAAIKGRTRSRDIGEAATAEGISRRTGYRIVKARRAAKAISTQ